MDDLVERVRLALAGQYPGAPNGRVRDVPDRRAIRWYATTGLVDRPAAMRGRTALYGPRHLLQLVAVKRRQADGRTLAEIQAELAGATDATLAGIAHVPDELLADDDPGPGHAAPPVRARFWADAPADAATAPAVPPVPAAAAVVAAQTPHARPLAGVALGGGAVLLVPGRLADDDYPAIATAAAPLVDLLTRRGLLGDQHPQAGPPTHHDGSSR